MPQANDNSEAIKSAISAVYFFGQSEQDIPVYSYQTMSDFEKLWFIAEHPESIGDFERIVVIADGIPNFEPDNPFAKWLPVHSWVVAFLHNCPDPPLILILDLDFSSKDQNEIYQVNFGKNVQWFGPILEEGSNFFVDSFLEKLKNIESFSGSAVITAIDYWEKLKSSRVRNLSPLETSHGLSNDVGSAFMWAGLNKHNSDKILERSFSFLLKCIFPLDQEVGEETGSQEAEVETDANLLPEKKLNITLVDDQHTKYIEVIKAALQENKYVVQRYDINKISVEGKKEVFEEEDESKYVSHVFNEDIIFLDLRLWVIDNKDSSKELAEIEKYKKIAASLVKENPSSNLSTFYAQINNAKGSHRRLALLPIVIAEMDPSLPIVLFSSTQHRSVIQAVRNIPSIITDFSKPYLGGEDPDSANPLVVLEDLSCAVERAINLTEIRVVWKQAVHMFGGERGTKESKLELYWFDGWGTHKIDCPMCWLRTTWLPLAQRGDYAVAATLPWKFLQSNLGKTRLAILLKHFEKSTEDVKTIKIIDCFKIIFSAHESFPLSHEEGKAAKESSSDREIAIAAALALLELLRLWSSPIKEI